MQICSCRDWNFWYYHVFIRRTWNDWISCGSFFWLMSSDLVLSSNPSSLCVFLGLPKHSSSFFLSLRVMGIQYTSTNPLKSKEKSPFTCRSVADSWRNGSSPFANPSGSVPQKLQRRPRSSGPLWAGGAAETKDSQLVSLWQRARGSCGAQAPQTLR